MLKINTTAKYAELKFDNKSDLYPLNEISYTVENDSETVSFYNRFYNKIVTEQISNIQVNDVPVTRDNIQELLSVLFAGYEVTGGGTVDLSNYYTKPETNTLLETKVDKVEGKQLSTEDYTTEEKTKLAGLENYDDTTVKTDIASNTAAIEAEVTRAKAAEKVNADAIIAVDAAYKAADTALHGNIDAEVTRATNAESALDAKIDTKVDKVEGKQLSTEDYTTAEKTKLASLENYDDTDVKTDIAANTEAIEAEVVRAKAAEKVNADAISALDAAYKTADATLDTKIDAEVTRATNAESELNTKIETKVDKVSGKQLSTEDYTTAEKSKLASLSNYDDSELRTLIETKADKDKYEKVEGKDYSSFTTFNIDSKIKYQYVDMNEANTNTVQLYLFSIPSDEISDFHVLVKGNSTKSVEVKAGSYNIAWKETPDEIVNGAFYEFIFTIFKTQNKVFAGYIKYE